MPSGTDFFNELKGAHDELKTMNPRIDGTEHQLHGPYRVVETDRRVNIASHESCLDLLRTIHLTTDRESA